MYRLSSPDRLGPTSGQASHDNEADQPGGPGHHGRQPPVTAPHPTIGSIAHHIASIASGPHRIKSVSFHPSRPVRPFRSPNPSDCNMSMASSYHEISSPQHDRHARLGGWFEQPPQLKIYRSLFPVHRKHSEDNEPPLSPAELVPAESLHVPYPDAIARWPGRTGIAHGAVFLRPVRNQLDECAALPHPDHLAHTGHCRS